MAGGEKQPRRENHFRNILGLHKGKNNIYSHPKHGSTFSTTKLYTNELPAWRTMRKNVEIHEGNDKQTPTAWGMRKHPLQNPKTQISTAFSLSHTKNGFFPATHTLDNRKNDILAMEKNGKNVETWRRTPSLLTGEKIASSNPKIVAPSFPFAQQHRK